MEVETLTLRVSRGKWFLLEETFVCDVEYAKVLQCPALISHLTIIKGDLST